MESYIPITRSDLAQIRLVPAQLAGEEAVQIRWRSLHKATFFGNVMEEKVRVYLQGKEAVYRLETTLWACTKEWVVFKDSVRVPVTVVLRVESYQASEV